MSELYKVLCGSSGNVESKRTSDEPLFQSPKKKRMKQRPLSSAEKQTVLNIHTQIIESWPPGSPAYSSLIVKKTAETAGISRATVYNILKEYKETREVKSPPPRKPKISKYGQLDDMTLGAIRRKVHSYFLNNEIPTLDKVLMDVNADDTLPNFSRTGLHGIIRKKLKFIYARRSRKSLLIDQNEIVVWRVRYLEEIRKLRTEYKKIYYTGETWLNEGHIRDLVWQDTTVKSVKEAHREDLSKKLVIGHIGSSEGFLSGGELIFEAKKRNGDYHSEMDAYEKWFEGILTKVESGSVIVLDNSPYHCRRVERVPTTATGKVDIQEWLRQKNIQFNERELRAQLLQKVKAHKHNYQAYVIDEMAREKGVTVLRLPPYHCELNPIELIWSQFKGYVASRNKTLKLSEIKLLIPEALASITPERWQNCITHVLEEEKKMSRIDDIMDNMVERFITNVGGSSSADSDDDENSDEVED